MKSLADRGMLQDVFPKEQVSDLASLLEKSARSVYAGFDPTADSLHIGNLLVLVGLLHFQRAGHTPIALLGGATGRIGDPSGRSSERSLLPSDIIDRNLKGLKQDVERVFTNHERYFWPRDGGQLAPVRVVNNHHWYQDMNIVEFLASVGRYFRVGRMLSRQSVKVRLESEQGISLTEFAYQTFQAYDWLRLYQEQECLLQLGGSDQMGNIAAGQELISRLHDTQVFGLTLPLVLSESGSKFGKSAGVPVWLSPEKTSPFNFYQYFMRVPDGQVESLLFTFTFLPPTEIRHIMERHRGSPEARLAQQRLAEAVTLLVHGEEGLHQAETTTGILYRNDMASLGRLSLEEARAVFQQADFLQRLYQPGLSVLDVALKIGCFKTERDAVRIIGAGGLYINQQRCTNTEEAIVPGIHILANSLMLVRVGKKNYYIVEWT